MGKKLQKAYLNILIVQDLWQAHSQMLLIGLLKEFIKLNVNMDLMIDMKPVELDTKIATAFWNRQTLKFI